MRTPHFPKLRTFPPFSPICPIFPGPKSFFGELVSSWRADLVGVTKNVAQFAIRVGRIVGIVGIGPPQLPSLPGPGQSPPGAAGRDVVTHSVCSENSLPASFL